MGGLPPPRAIVTAPPYLDMHDYGNTSQIGVRGQPLGEYLYKMAALLRDCYMIAADDATFWLVAEAIRRDGRLIPLPDRLVACAEGVMHPKHVISDIHNRGRRTRRDSHASLPRQAAESAVELVEYGGVPEFLMQHGSGPGGKNAADEVDRWRARGGQVRWRAHGAAGRGAALRLADGWPRVGN